MKHLGDITKINGAEIEPVDVITFGSPCQDLSVAGKRAGLAGERSGLFMEAARIIKEMRCATDGIYPNFAVWENVPGAFSSNKGEDFRAVLEEFCRIVEPGTVIPEPPNGKWNTSGAIVGNGWSLAWRILDAQFWGVPQRRRRIALVMDFGGQSAPEILFVRKGMSGDPSQSGKARKRITKDIARRAGTAGKPVTYGIGGYNSEGMKSRNPHAGIYLADTSRTLDINGGNPACNQGGIAICEPEVTHTLDTCTDKIKNYVAISTLEPIAVHQNADGEVRAGKVANTLNTNSNASGRNAPLVAVYDARGNGDGLTAPTMTGDHQRRTSDYTALAICHFDTTQITSPQNGCNPQYGDPCHPLCATAHVPAIVESYQKVSGPLMANSHPGSYTGQDAYTDMLVTEPIATFQNTGIGWWNQSDVAQCLRTPCGGDSTKANLVAVAGIDCRNLTEHPELYPTMQSKDQGGWSLNYSHAVRIRYRVRRLTPLECERLQGYPDCWTVLPVIEDMTDVTYEFWRQLLFDQAVREEKARLNAETGIYKIWRFIVPKADEESKNKAVGYWENTGKPYKHKSKVQMVKWYNSSFADPGSTDSVRYKALGNSIALPPWKWVLKRISAQFERDATLGSLFDGIGGFPLIWERLNGDGSARWASEIELFPIAVTKHRFSQE